MHTACAEAGRILAPGALSLGKIRKLAKAVSETMAMQAAPLVLQLAHAQCT